jgi:alpha-N-arabinofuranosidase
LQYPIWIGAVGEAIYTLGAERNGDIVIGASYAPGFQNLNNFQWGVSLLNLDYR